jgi:nicotinamidase-related amidase
MQPLSAASSALLILDVQKGFDEIEAAGTPRNNPQALARIVELMAAFRAARAPLIHVRHASREPDSPFCPERPGYAASDEAREQAGEPVIIKHVNSAFIGTDLEQRLRDLGARTLVIVGATTNHCVETTARMAGNLGFDARVVEDATWTFDRVGPHGERHAAQVVHQMTLANLHGEFAEIVRARDVIATLIAAPAAAEVLQAVS